MWNKFFQKGTGHQAPLLQHLNGEVHQLRQSNHYFDTFFIHIFCQMLLQQGFQDDNEPFCIGRIIAKWISNKHGQHIYQISFEPKWKPPDGINHYLYIGKALSKSYSILPKYDPKIKYRVHCTKYQIGLCCRIMREQIKAKDNDDHHLDTSSTNESMTDESNDNVTNDMKKNALVSEMVENEDFVTTATDPTKIENENNQEQPKTIVQNKLLNRISDKSNTVNASNDQNNDSLVTENIENENISTFATGPPEIENQINRDQNNIVDHDTVDGPHIDSQHDNTIATILICHHEQDPTDNHLLNDDDGNGSNTNLLNIVTNKMV